VNYLGICKDPLKAINSFLSQDNDELSSIGISKIICNIIEGGNVNTLCVELRDNGYDWGEFESSCLANSKSLSLGVDRGISTQITRIDTNLLMRFFSHPKRLQQLFGHHRRDESSNERVYELSEKLSRFIKIYTAKWRC